MIFLEDKFKREVTKNELSEVINVPVTDTFQLRNDDDITEDDDDQNVDAKIFRNPICWQTFNDSYEASINSSSSLSKVEINSFDTHEWIVKIEEDMFWPGYQRHPAYQCL